VTLLGLQAARAEAAGRATPDRRTHLVLDALARKPLSRREIQAATGLSLHHVRAALTELVEAGTVTVSGPARSPARRYSRTARPEPPEPAAPE
jgi:predicted ArsR family transcriptional regulator